MRVRAVLLDLDGTLIDSNDAHALAWVDAGREFGIEIHFDDVRPLIGMGGDKVLPRVAGLEEDDERGAKLLERRGEIFRENYLPSLRAFSGTRALLERMREDGMRLVVATSASEEDLEALLSQAGIRDLVDDATHADAAEESKPAPDIVQAALARAGAPAGAVLMIGDTPYDVEAARRAGIRVIAVRCGGWDDAALQDADAIYDDPRALLEQYEESMLAAGH